MSWFSWDNANLTKIASSTLKNVQNKIDKVLDIQEEGQSASYLPSSTSKSEDSSTSQALSNSDDFFTSWIGNSQTTPSSPKYKDANRNASSKTAIKPEVFKPEFSDDGQSVELHASPCEPIDDNKPTDDSNHPDNTAGAVEGDWLNSESMTMSALEGHLASSWFVNSQAPAYSSTKFNSEDMQVPSNDFESPMVIEEPSNRETFDEDNRHSDENQPHSTVQVQEQGPDEISQAPHSKSTNIEVSLDDSEQPVTDPLKESDITQSVRVMSDSLRGSHSSLPGLESSRLSNLSESTLVKEMTGSESEKESTSLTLSASSAGEMIASGSDSQFANITGADEGGTIAADKQLEEDTGMNVSAVSSTDSYIKCEAEDKEPLNVDVTSYHESDVSPKPTTSSDETKKRKDSDEAETTTTSSDIEVISCCTSNNGDASQITPGLTPNIAYGTRIASDVLHKRSASGTLYVIPDDSVSKNVNVDLLNRDEIMKLSDPHSGKADIQKKYLETTEILEIRETRMVELSRENIELKEANGVLRQQLEQAEQLHESEMTDINTLTKEFTNRLADAEKRFQTASRERDNLKKRIQQIELDSNKSGDKRAELLLKEKEEQIAELMQEGEKMAQEQLKSNNIIKKVRAREKELEASVKQLNESNDKSKSEIEHLKKVLDNKAENEKKHTEGIKQLTKVVQTQEKEITNLKCELEESREKCRSLQNALDSCTKELSETQKLRWESEANCTSLSKELASLQESQSTVSANQQSWRDEKEQLTNELEELRITLSRQERDAARREDQMRAEISYIQSRFAAAEERNEELSQMVTSATRPVLKQLETLQANYASQNTNWELAEQALNERLADTKKRLAGALEQEQILKDQYNELENSLVTAEAQVSALRQEKSKLAAQLQTTQSKNQLLEEEKEKLQVQFDCQKSSFERQLNDAKKEIIYLENSLELEKHKLDVEKQRSTSLTNQIIAAQKQQQQKSHHSRTPSESSQRSSSESGPPTPTGSHSGSSIIGDSMFSSASSKRNSESVYNVIRGHGSAYALDHMQETLKRKDGEINQLYSEVHQLERTRSSLMAELSKQSTRCDELDDTVKQLTDKVSKMAELEAKHSALLLMYGEKLEENEELKLDLRDVKEMYKSQINMLLKES